MTDCARPAFTSWPLAAIAILLFAGIARAQDPGAYPDRPDVRVSMPEPARAVRIDNERMVAGVLAFEALNADAAGFHCWRLMFETLQTGSQGAVGDVTLAIDVNRNGDLDGEDEPIHDVQYDLHGDERFDLEFEPVELDGDRRQVLIVYHFQAAEPGFWQFRLMGMEYGDAEYIHGLPLTGHLLWMEQEQEPAVRVRSVGSQLPREFESDGGAEIPVGTLSFQAPEDTHWEIETMWVEAAGMPLGALQGVLFSVDYDQDGSIDDEFDVGVEYAEEDQMTIKTAWRIPLGWGELLQHRGRASISFTFYVETEPGMEVQLRLLAMRTHGDFGVTGLLATGPRITIVEPEYLDISVRPGPGMVDRTVPPDTLNHTLAWFMVEAEDQSSLASIRVRAVGAGHDAGGIQALRFVHDRNGNGIQDADDHLLRELAGFPSDDGWLTLNTWDYHGSTAPGYLPLPPVQPVSLLLAVDFPVNTPLGSTFGVILQSIAIPGLHETTGLPLVGSMLTVDDLVDPELRFTLLNPLDREVAPGTRHHVVASLRIDSVARPSSVDSLTFRAIGDTLEPVDVLGVALIRDHDGNSAVAGLDAAGGDRILATAVFHSDDGALTMETGGISLPGGGSVQLLIVWTLAGSVPDGRMVALQVTGVGTSAPIVHDLPLTSAAFTVATSGADDADPAAADVPPLTPAAAGGAGLLDPCLTIAGTAAGCAAGADDATGVLLALVALVLVTVRRCAQRIVHGKSSTPSNR